MFFRLFRVNSTTCVAVCCWISYVAGALQTLLMLLGASLIAHYPCMFFRDPTRQLMGPSLGRADAY